MRSAEAAYCADPPSNQTAIDIFKGTWTSAFPPDYGVTAGTLDSFDDVRVRWASGILPGGFTNLSILELGDPHLPHPLGLQQPNVVLA